jgi:hypothetical protein
MHIYLQKFGGEIANDNVFTAYLGFDHQKLRDSSIKIHFFEDIDQVPIRKDEYGLQPMVVGYIDDTIKYIQRCNKPVPYQLNIPDALRKEQYLGREIKFMTLGEFKKETKLPVFVKPDEYIKRFSSGIIKNQTSKKELFEKDSAGDPLDEDQIVLTSDVVDMVSEYRCFMNWDSMTGKHKIIGIRHYQGDCTIFPDINSIKEMAEAYHNAPRAYGLDVAIIKKQVNDSMTNLLNSIRKDRDMPEKNDYVYKTVLVECQDMWSIGAYGLDPVIYANLLKKRWYEIFPPAF